MSAPALPAVRRAVAAAAALTAVDAVYAALMARRSRLPDLVFGPSSGAWRDWGVGVLVSYTAAQAVIAARPTPTALRDLALLRGVLVPGHAAAAIVNPRRRLVWIGGMTMNATVAALALRAQRAASSHGCWYHCRDGCSLDGPILGGGGV